MLMAISHPFFAIELYILVQITKNGTACLRIRLLILLAQPHDNSSRCSYFLFRRLGSETPTNSPTAALPRESDESYQSHRKGFRNLNPVWSNYHDVTPRLSLVYEFTVFVLVAVTKSVFSDDFQVSDSLVCRNL